MMVDRAIIWAVMIAATANAAAQQPASPLTIRSESLPSPVAHQNYEFGPIASGGVPPLHWQTSRGNLPEGLHLDPTSGVISGVPSGSGDFDFTLSVIDSVGNTASRDYKGKIVPPLLLEWSTFPRVQGEQIVGSVKVSNGTKDPFDLTVIILAVNDYGKAFALGYQRFDLRPETSDVEIAFGSGSTLPVGAYTVHADAVAEVPAKDSIFRGRQQTPAPLHILLSP